MLQYNEKKALRALAELICSGEIQPKMVLDNDVIRFTSIFNPHFKPSFE